MKEAIKKNKKVIIISVAIIFILLLGIAYAYLRTTLAGQEEYVIRAGTLDLVLTEDNELTLEKQIPIEDNEGMSLNGFSFSLTNNGNIDTDYTIYLDDIPLDEGESRIPDSTIRYSLTRNDDVIGPKNLTTMGSDPNRRVDFGTIGVDKTINYTLRIWIDYDATKEEASGKTFKGKLRVVATQPVGEEVGTVLLENIPKDNLYDDGVDTFITGEDPNNYIWYSGKLWRAVSVNNEEKTVKLVTQWDISAISYDDDSSAFEGSHMEMWLNDTTVDGFLGNLRDYENFIVTDAKWDATMDDTELGSIERPNGTTVVTAAVGLLNMYEYQTSYRGTDYSNGYLNNGLYWWILNNYNDIDVWFVLDDGSFDHYVSTVNRGIRPSINLRSEVKIISGDGTKDNPYRLKGDNDKDLTGTFLNTRYSGEYISFGIGENNLYRIVSHESLGLTKITSAEPLKSSGTFLSSMFGDNISYSNSNTIGTFLNGDYLTNYVGNDYANMIEDSTTWYIGTVSGGDNYKLAKYTDTNMSNYASVVEARVGLLRLGELMASQTNRRDNNNRYWLLTPYNNFQVRSVYTYGDVYYGDSVGFLGIKPSLNLKSNVIITGGDGTKENPFTLELAN